MKRLLFLCLLFLLLLSSTAYGKGEKERIFIDVKQDYWASDAINNQFYRGIVDGYSDKTFKPQNTITRVQFIKMLVKANQYSLVDSSIPYIDVSSSFWGKDYIETAFKNGIIKLEDFGEILKPNQPITREEIAIMVARSLQLQPITTAPKFKDSYEMDHPDLIAAVMEANLMSGHSDGTFGPKETSNRAQSAVVLERMLALKKIPKPLTVTEITNIIEIAEDTVVHLLIDSMDYETNTLTPFSKLESKVTRYYGESLTNRWKNIYENDWGWLYEPSELIPFTMSRLNFSIDFITQTSDTIMLSFKTAADEAGYTNPGIRTYELKKINGSWKIESIHYRELDQPFDVFEAKWIVEETGLWEDHEKNASVRYLAKDKNQYYVFGLYNNSNQLIGKKYVDPINGMIVWMGVF